MSLAKNFVPLQERLRSIDGYAPSDEMTGLCIEAKTALAPHINPSWLPWISPLFPDYNPGPSRSELKKARDEELLSQLAIGEISFTEYAAEPDDDDEEEDSALASPTGSRSSGVPIASAFSSVEIIDTSTVSSDTTPVKAGAKGKQKEAAATSAPSDPKKLPAEAVLVRLSRCLLGELFNELCM